MALGAWIVVAREGSIVAMRRDADCATLIVEALRPAEHDPDLRAAIARLAPHLEFDPLAPGATERTARDASGRYLAVGRVTRGATSVAYLAGGHEPVDARDTVGEIADEPPAAFAHLVD